jgi:ATP-binding cassette, subfamily F, member 3
MSLLLVTEVKKHYGPQDVLRGATLQIDPGEKLGLVGKNGGGKSTLLRLIEGLEKPDGGKIVLRKGARLGHVPQIPEFAPEITVRAFVEGGMQAAHDVSAELERLHERMAHAHGRELDRLIHEQEALHHRLEFLGGFEVERRIETVLAGIGLARGLWDREARTLSGGEKSRTALARELVAGHDLLLLDEPTNHLDLAGIEWIEAWLREMKSAVLIVSHDRRLLDNAVDAILELERGELRRFPGNYSKYVALREERFASELRAWEIQSDFIRKEEEFIRRHIGSQRTAEAKGRQKKLENVVRLERPYNDLHRPVIRPPAAARGGELVLEARELAGGYGERALFRGVDLRIGRGQRVGIVGPNGSGKSTLLKILAGRMAPLEGRLERGHKSLCGYYDQETGELELQGTPYLELRRENVGATDLELRSHLARFLFRGDEVDKPISALSGGERARVCLAKLTLKTPSWLALDEPTNHLDLAARTALEEMLGAFDGAFVCVSHDRAFLDALCTQIIEVSGGVVRVFSGNYSAYRRALDQQRSDANVERDQRKTAEKKRAAAPQAARPPAPPSARRRPRNPYQLEKLEERIIALEGELAHLHAACASEDVYRNHERLREAQIRISEIEVELAAANEEWSGWDT